MKEAFWGRRSVYVIDGRGEEQVMWWTELVFKNREMKKINLIIVFP
jgi:hypothetical protein